MKFFILHLVYCFVSLLNYGLSVEIENAGSNSRESKKLFGGYKITPRLCIATRRISSLNAQDSLNICMFNHECLQRNGQVVGACMDGFLFGACCQLPSSAAGELLESDIMAVQNVDNKLTTKVSSITFRPQTTPLVDITSSGVSQITAALLNQQPIPTAQDNVIVQLNGGSTSLFSTPGVKHPAAPDTILQGDNEISSSFFKPTMQPMTEDRKTTLRVEGSTVSYAPMVEISVSNAPLVYTPSPGYAKPIFRPKPQKPSDADKYVLVPTISHESTANKPNKTQEYNSIVNIIQMLNQSTTIDDRIITTRKPPSTSYVTGPTPPRRPPQATTKKPSTSYVSSTSLLTSSSRKPISTTSKKPPSTSYIFSTTVPPRRTTPSTTTTKKQTTSTKKTKPTTRPKKPTNPNTTNRPGHSTLAYSPSAYTYLTSSTNKPPSTSYVYSPIPTRRPPSTVDSHIVGPGFSVSSRPSQYATTYSSPPPTVIVLAPVTDEPERPQTASAAGSGISTYQSPQPQQPTKYPQRKPINQVTINNHITQNIYSTSPRPDGPSPTVYITPKPSISSTFRPGEENFSTAPDEVETSADELINFPPVRNPNLNMSHPVISDDDITTPGFIEDDALNEKVESFVNKIIQGLQEPFQGLKDIVVNNKTTLGETTTKKPAKTTTKKPKPSNTSSSSRPQSGSAKPTTSTRRPTTKRPATTTKKTRTTTKPQKTTRKPAVTTTTTTQSYIEQETLSTEDANEETRSQCGIRPLLKTGRIVGGKGATFGEFPWQVLVRESTWLGLFTKNKCGGVLISNRYVMTAAHCQPGFLASLVAVFGEFDISGDLESKRPISRNVKRVIVHRQYDAATFANDLALLELEHPVQFDSHIVPICLPREGEDFTGRMATVTGWGRLKYGGGVPSVLQEVQVPIMENHVCQEMFRTAGHSKVILESFLCAGYANGQKDSCEGDSGGPLVLQRPDGRYQLAGTVSHGIKCAAPYLPGVYMRTTYYKPWITSITGIN